MLRRVKEGEEISPMRKRLELYKQNPPQSYTCSDIYEEKHKLIRYIERKTEMLTRLNENEGVICIEDQEIYKIVDRIKKRSIEKNTN